MTQLHDRLASLSPEQRALLEKKLREKGMNTAIVTPPSQDQAPASAMMQAMAQKLGTGTATKKNRPRRTDKGMEFSLFFFSGDGSTEERDKYNLLLDTTRFADEHGFAAVWTPERHFEDFGGLYPNPSVLSAGLATVTKNIQLRAGSVALPLHHPIRFCEEWSVVDNLSGGRVAVAFASGWHPHDFILAPESTPEYYENRKAKMFDNIALIRRLWGGETVQMKGIYGEDLDVRVLPRPLQPELDIWVASQGNVETFIQAGEAGCHLLTGVVNQSLDELEDKISQYREALARNGYDPEKAKVTAMMHTCLGASDDEVREKVRQPMQDYLKTFIRQQKNILQDYNVFSEADQDAIVRYAFDQYFENSALFGTVEKCSRTVQDLIDIGVTEVACLTDFGIDLPTAQESMKHLVELKDRFTK